jgi:hypothetical protein
MVPAWFDQWLCSGPAIFMEIRMADEKQRSTEDRATGLDALDVDQFNKNDRKSAGAADIKQKLSEDVDSATEFARQHISDAKDQAEDVADSQKNFIAGKMSGVAIAIDKVAAELEAGDDQDIGKFARSLSSTMRTFSDGMQDRSLGEIAGMAEDFGRKQPIAFLGFAAVAGLAASRFLTASAHNSHSTPASSRQRNQDNGLTGTERPMPAPSIENSTEARTDG